MERKMKALFEYQEFSPNVRLTNMITETERKYTQLSDDELMMIAAAGEPMLQARLKEGVLFHEENDIEK